MVAADGSTRPKPTTLMMNSRKEVVYHGTPNFANPDAYDYEDATPDIRRDEDGKVERRVNRHNSCSSLPQRMPRRSSLKQGDGSIGRRRRASIQMGNEITVYLPGQEEPVKRRNSIKFSESVKVRNIEKMDQLTDSPKDLWFQGEDYARMRRNSWDLVNRVESGQTGIGSKKFCLRGLERLLDRETVQHKREQAWETVFTQQDLQRDRGSFDEEFVAKAYRRSTNQCAEAAVCRGKQDEKAIFSYVRGVSGYCRRLSC